VFFRSAFIYRGLRGVALLGYVCQYWERVGGKGKAHPLALSLNSLYKVAELPSWIGFWSCRSGSGGTGERSAGAGAVELEQSATEKSQKI